VVRADGEWDGGIMIKADHSDPKRARGQWGITPSRAGQGPTACEEE